MDDKEKESSPPRKFPWFRRSMAYVLKPQTLLGGVVAFGAAQGAEFYLAFRASQDGKALA